MAGEWRAGLKAWADKVGDNLDALARVAIQDLCEGVVDDTPVDTGFLVGNWQPDLAPPAGTTVARPAGSHGGSGNSALTMARLAMVVPEIKAGVIFWMSNNAEYAMYQELGTSKMVGRLFVQRNLAKWDTYVQNAAIKLGIVK